MNSGDSAPRPDTLKLAPGEEDEAKEMSFELDFLRTLTVEQRFELMFTRSREMAELLKAHGHAEAPGIVKRK